MLSGIIFPDQCRTSDTHPARAEPFERLGGERREAPLRLGANQVSFIPGTPFAGLRAAIGMRYGSLPSPCQCRAGLGAIKLLR